MKKTLLSLALCLTCSAAFAQVLDVASVNKIAIPQSNDAVVAGISPLGDYILVTNAQNKGLSKFDLATGKVTTITQAAGAGFEAKISDDGSQVVYRETSTRNHLRASKINKYDFATGAATNLVSESRNIQGVALEGDAAVAINKGKMATKSLSGRKAKASAPVFSIKNGQLMITRSGRTSVFSPNGKQFSYIWASLSPDQTKVLYYVCGVGAFVADLNGNITARLGIVRAPPWYGNDVVVGMHDIDNGEVVTSSSIVAVDLNGTRQTLTDDSVIAMYPQVSAQTGKIAFSTADGEAYIININNK